MDLSPFTLDANFDTTNIAEEANRLFQQLEGPHAAASLFQPGAGNSAGSTPLNLFSGAGTPVAGIAMASLNPSPLPPNTVMLHTSIKGAEPDTPMGSNGASGAGGSQGSDGSTTPAFTSYADIKNAEMLKALTDAVNRAKAAEMKVEELEDQIKTMSFGGGMLGDVSATVLWFIVVMMFCAGVHYMLPLCMPYTSFARPGC